MKSITKRGNGGYQLETSHQIPPTTSAQATSRWSSFGYKMETKIGMLYEQYGLCAYSEIQIDQQDPLNLGSHIEHLKPKSTYPEQTFDYSNLVLSAISSENLQLILKEDIFGGHAKGSQYNPLLFISCLQTHSPRYFIYPSTGHIEPAGALTEEEQKMATYTIDLLNLNSPYLVNLRKKWLDELDEIIDEHIQKNWSLSDLASVCLLPKNQSLEPFFTATRQRFKQLSETILENHAPDLI